MPKKILFIMTASDHWTLSDGTRQPAGFWAEEAMAPYRIFKEAGYEIEVASPGGVQPTVDAQSLTPEYNGGPDAAEDMKRALEAASELASPRSFEQVDLDDYVAIFVPGGWGPMEDLSSDAACGQLLVQALASGRPLSLVCHGPAALLSTLGAQGSFPFAGYRMTGLSNAEEQASGLAARAKWLLEDRLTAAGADYTAGEPFAPYVVVDRTLITGQNPASSAPLAKEVLKFLG